LGLGNLQKIAPMITCDATVTMIQHGKGSQTKSEGSRVQIQVSPNICVLSTMNSYQAASPGVIYCKRYLPWFITSTIINLVRKRVVRNENLGIF